jgi:hypothetical protein
MRSIQLLCGKITSDLWQVGGFLKVFRVSSSQKTDSCGMVECDIKHP